MFITCRIVCTLDNNLIDPYLFITLFYFLFFIFSLFKRKMQKKKKLFNFDVWLMQKMWENGWSVSLILVSPVPYFVGLCMKKKFVRAWRHSYHSRMCDVNVRWRQQTDYFNFSSMFVHFIFFLFKLRVHQPIIIGKNYTKLYRIIHFIYLTFPISYMRCRCELLYQSKIHILCCVPIHKFSPMNSTHEIQKKHTQSKRKSLFIFSKIKGKKCRNNKQSNADLVGFLYHLQHMNWIERVSQLMMTMNKKKLEKQSYN